MAGKTFESKGYSSYTDIPAARRGGYDHGQENLVNQYLVKYKTIRRTSAPDGGFSDFVGSPSKIELLKEYVGSPTMSGSPNYATMNNYEDYVLSSSNKLMLSNHIPGYSEPGLTKAGHIRTGNISGPNKPLQRVGPPTTHHPLTTSTNNVNEALGLLEESVYHSRRASPRPRAVRRRGVLDNLSTSRALPLEPQRQYARPAFVFK